MHPGGKTTYQGYYLGGFVHKAVGEFFVELDKIANVHIAVVLL